MAQVTIYMDNQLESKIKELASSTGVSISKFISKILEKKITNSWSDEVKELSGQWNDFSSLEEIRDTKAQDTQREEF